MPSILITGSNRGLGLEWAHQYGAAGWRVYATCRYPEQSVELHQLAQSHPQVTLHRLDVTRYDEINVLARELGSASIDILVNNAGVYHEKYKEDRLGAIDYDAWLDTLRVNTQGAIRTSEALIDHVSRSGKRLIVAITSHMGSIAEIDMPGSYAYRSSKAALNAAMKGLSLELKPRRVGVLLLHPGWVRTRMGGADAPLTASESVQGMRAIIDRFTLQMSGHFYRYDNSKLPW